MIDCAAESFWHSSSTPDSRFIFYGGKSLEKRRYRPAKTLSRHDTRKTEQMASLDYEHFRLANRRFQVLPDRTSVAGSWQRETVIPRSVNIRDRRASPSSFCPPTPTDDRARVHACASRARIIIIFVISWHSARRAHQSENRINWLSHSRPNSKYGGSESLPRFPRSSPSPRPVKYHLIPREIRFNFARRDIPGSPPSSTHAANRNLSDVIFRRKMSRSPENVELLSEIKLRRGCGNEIDTRFSVVKMPPVKSLSSATLYFPTVRRPHSRLCSL